MTKPGRQTALLVLIIAMISLGAAGAHSATHATLDLQSCDLCSAQGNPAFAIPPALPDAVPALASLTPEITRLRDAETATLVSWNPRAPPRAD